MKSGVFSAGKPADSITPKGEQPMRIASILNEKEITLSCEVFPPKHFDGIAQASAVAQEIAGLHPSFMSVTYGAAGSTPGHTIAVAKAVAETGVTPLCHLTCVQSTREHVQHVLADMKTAGMENVLALRGDLPKEGEPCHDFAYAAELIDFIHQQGDFCVGAACYPEGHPESGSRAKDMDYLRRKVDAGVDFLTTQMFFDNGLLYNFLYSCIGCSAREWIFRSARASCRFATRGRWRGW
jgi:methylenetetrahydrofolate reductase (NADPH)